MKSLIALAALASAATAQAQIITIDQAKALADHVTPGDAPGILHQDRGTIRQVEFEATTGNILSILGSDGYPVLVGGNRFRNGASKAFDAARALSLGNNLCNTAAC